MAVDRDLAPSLQDTSGEYVHNFHHLLKGSGGHVLPVLVLKPDVTVEEKLGIVAETNHGVDAVCAVGMLR